MSQDLAYSYQIYRLDLLEYTVGPSPFSPTGVLGQYDVLNDLPTIPTPTLITVGADDIVSPRTAWDYGRRMQNAQVSVFTESAHLPNITEERRFLNTVRQFRRYAGQRKVA